MFDARQRLGIRWPTYKMVIKMNLSSLTAAALERSEASERSAHLVAHELTRRHLIHSISATAIGLSAATAAGSAAVVCPRSRTSSRGLPEPATPSKRQGG